jgi:hypothetical protein
MSVNVTYNISESFMVGAVEPDMPVPSDPAERKTWRRRFMREAAEKIATAMLENGCLSIDSEYSLERQERRTFVVARAGKRDSIRLPK